MSESPSGRIALSVLLLMAAFRSVVIPLVSAGLTLLSTGAAYGVIVAVFQWGWLGGGIDNGTTAPVDPWIPLMLFALLFGFSMDYQVFLVSRIREEWRAGAMSDSDAVASGLARTGRIITSAAAIMICVFAAFVLGDLRVLRVIGLGMAVGGGGTRQRRWWIHPHPRERVRAGRTQADSGAGEPGPADRRGLGPCCGAAPRSRAQIRRSSSASPCPRDAGRHAWPG